MDRRQLKTRKAIFAAFEELISQKPYSEITVREIIDLADVGRTTFYAHFETKDGVLDALCADLFSHIFADTLTCERTHDFSGQEKSENNILVHTLYHLKEDKSRYKKLFRGESADIFWDRFKVRFEEELVRQSDRGIWKSHSDYPDDLYRKLYITSFVEIVKWWFQNGCEESPEQIEIWFKAFCI